MSAGRPADREIIVPLQFITQRFQFQRLLSSPIGKTAVIYPMAFLAGLAGGMAVLGMVFFADDRLRATPAQVGMVAAVWSVFYVIGCFLLRPLATRLHPRHSLLAATSLLAVTVYAICLAPTLLWAGFFYALFGLSVALFWPPIMGWLSAGIEGPRLGRALGWFSLSWSSGSILGQGLAGWLSDIHTVLPLAVSATIYLSAACLILGAILALPHLADDAPAPDREPAGAVSAPRSLAVAGWVGAFAVFISLGVFMNVFPIAAKNQLGFSRSLVGVIQLFRVLAYSICLGAFGWLKFWHYRRRPMMISLALTAVLCAGLIPARSAWQFMALATGLGAIMAFAYSNSIFHGASSVSGDAARRSWQMAIHEGVVSGGVIMGSVVGGLIYGSVNAAAAYAMCAAMALLGLLAQMLIIRHGGKF